MKNIFYLIIFAIISFGNVVAEEEPKPEQKEIVEEQITFDTSASQPAFWKLMFNTMVTLIVIIILVMAIAWILKRIFTTKIKQGNKNNKIKIIERRAISTRSILYLMEVDNKKILIADSQINGVSHLSEIINNKTFQDLTKQ